MWLWLREAELVYGGEHGQLLTGYGCCVSTGLTLPT
jgi:hypothetical protein